MEKEEYDRLRNEHAKLGSAEERLSHLRRIYTEDLWFEFGKIVLDNVLTSGIDDDFMTFEDYTRHRQSTSPLLNAAYNKLLDVPLQKGANLELFVTLALGQAGIKSVEDPKALQVKWVLQLYHDELQERWGGFRLVDGRYLPLGLLAMMRRKAVQWTMVL